MTPLQNDPQQHQREAKIRKYRVPRGGKRSPDSESAHRELSKSCIGSYFGPQTFDFTSSNGGGPRLGHQSAPGSGHAGSSCYRRMTPLQNGPQQHQREATEKNARFALERMEPGFGICAPGALEIRYRLDMCSTKMRFCEQLRWGHLGGGTNVHPGPTKQDPVYYGKS
jgi:hypothetical protein